LPSENGESENPEATVITSVDNEKAETETEPAPTPSENGTHEDVDKW